MMINWSKKYIYGLNKILDSIWIIISSNEIQYANGIAGNIGITENLRKNQKTFLDEFCEDENNTISREEKFKLIKISLYSLNSSKHSLY